MNAEHMEESEVEEALEENVRLGYMRKVRRPDGEWAYEFTEKGTKYCEEHFGPQLSKTSNSYRVGYA